MMQQQFRDLACYFQPGDIVTQILNAGLPAPIDIRVLGMHRDKNYEIAKQIKREVERVPGAADVCLHQVVDAPHLKWQVDRVTSRRSWCHPRRHIKCLFDQPQLKLSDQSQLLAQLQETGSPTTWRPRRRSAPWPA
jgi:hypothetical protein